MSFHLVGPYLSTTSTRKRKSTLNKKQRQELEDYNKERKVTGFSKFPASSSKVVTITNKFPDLRTPPGRSTEHIKSLNPHDMTPCTVNSIMDPRRLAKESPETREAILAKSRRLAPAYNKGAVQYISDDADLTDIGRKK